ncbi:hypothetical protein NEHOM01_2161 [Nematocida homosporus]|uniref:uncharacterized protein n=1 Tax=Nematocida homosporus TaxID=1912981 RepID=UPI0022209F70|nr:uncharacterized protein NEHOM01_2161 [Nematocida homosporus]KAI5187416.1 hypothetical protein NEHOM01_2161 [Nematocida homosporus]
MPYLKLDSAVCMNRPCRLKVTKWLLVIVLWSLLDLMDSVAGTSRRRLSHRNKLLRRTHRHSRFDINSITSDQLDKHGFNFSSRAATLTVTAYTPPTEQRSTLDLDPSLGGVEVSTNTPVCVVKAEDISVEFRVPSWASKSDKQEAIELFRRIAVIKVKEITIHIDNNNGANSMENMRILSRVINMVDCITMMISMESNPAAGQVCRDTYKKVSVCEALNTIQHAEYTLAFKVVFVGMGDSIDLIGSGIAMMRPITSISLPWTLSTLLHPASQLPLKPGYTLYILRSNMPTRIDLKDLWQAQSVKCGKIVIEPTDTLNEIVGLEDPTGNGSSTISLEAPWSLLQRLGRNNSTQIQVNRIIGTLPPVRDPRLTDQLLPTTPPAKAMIMAECVLTKIPPLAGCGHAEYYNKCYNQEACANYGVAAEITQVYYQKGRNDVYNTMFYLYLIKAITNIPPDTRGLGLVKCSGEGLSISGWIMPETVIIRLAYLLSRREQEQAKDENVRLCQHIQYNEIEIIGTQKPNDMHLPTCLKMLGLFQDLKARTLRIINVRSTNPNNTILGQAPPLCLLPDTIPYMFIIDTLVLDNVDEHLVYWMLTNHFFTKLVEVYILNQHRTNLAIIELLSRPIGSMIFKLVLNDFLGLDEVKSYVHYKKTGEIKDSFLFNYVAARKDEKQTNLGLDKLTLQLENVDVREYAEILATLAELKIQYEAIPFDTYVTRLIAKYQSRQDKIRAYCLKARMPISDDDELLVFYSINLKDLEADLLRRRAKRTEEPNPSGESAKCLEKTAAERLLLFFNDGQLLTQTSLTIILHWLHSRFIETSNLQLANIKVPEDARDLLLSQRYVLGNLGTFQIVTTNDELTNSSVIELQGNKYQIIRPADSGDLKPYITTLSYKMLPQILLLARESPTIMTPLHLFARYMKGHCSPIECPVCFQSPNLSKALRDSLAATVKMLEEEEKRKPKNDDSSGELEGEAEDEAEDELEDNKESELEDELEGEAEDELEDNKESELEDELEVELEGEAEDHSILCYLSCGHPLCASCPFLFLGQTIVCPLCRGQGDNRLFCMLVEAPTTNTAPNNDSTFITNPNLQLSPDQPKPQEAKYIYYSYLKTPENKNDFQKETDQCILDPTDPTNIQIE